MKEEKQKMKEIKSEKEVWKYFNKNRKRKETVSEKIGVQRWENISSNCWKRPRRGQKNKKRLKQKKKTRITKGAMTQEEIRRQIKR